MTIVYVNEGPAGPSHSAIIAAVAQAFGLLPDDITGRARMRPIVQARGAAALLCRWMLSDGAARRSWVAVGRIMGERDHSSVIYLADNAVELLRRSADYRIRMARARDLLTAAQADQAKVTLPQPEPVWIKPRNRFFEEGDPHPIAMQIGSAALREAVWRALAASSASAAMLAAD